MAPHASLLHFIDTLLPSASVLIYVYNFLLKVNYEVSSFVLDTNSAIPDLLYYWRFLSQLLTNRPYLGKGMNKDDFVHYNCFNKNGDLKEKELLMNYFVILIIATILWLYSPLLIYYFPSSEPTWPNYPVGVTHTEFHCTHKSPVYFGNLMRFLLGFYMGKEQTIKSRIRRLVFVSCTFAFSFRLFFTEYCRGFVCFMVVCLLITVIPGFWSSHLTDEQPTHFMNLLEYPEGSFRKNTRDKEYQLLAHCMKERICLILDWQFLKKLFSYSWRSLVFKETWSELFKNIPGSIHKIIISSCASLAEFFLFIISFMFYHLSPAFYFYKQLFFAITTAMSTNPLLAIPVIGFDCVITIAVAVCSFLLVFYLMIAMMFVCYLVAEVTMFTYIGAVVDPSMAFKYVSLVGAVSLLLYKLTKDLRENYDNLRDQIVETLFHEKIDYLSHLNKALPASPKKTFEKNVEPDGTIKVILEITAKPSKLLLLKDHYSTYLSKPLLEWCIEKCYPLRRRVAFLILKVIWITFYLLIALWVKNVFHKEKDVSSIFVIIQTIAMYFVPNLLQFLADKSPFGKKSSVDLHRDVHEAIITFATTGI